MIEAVRTSETLVYFNETTRRYILEGCCNLKAIFMHCTLYWDVALYDVG
jgi:hypothetical protein